MSIKISPGIFIWFTTQFVTRIYTHTHSHRHTQIYPQHTLKHTLTLSHCLCLSLSHTHTSTHSHTYKQVADPKFLLVCFINWKRIMRNSKSWRWLSLVRNVFNLKMGLKISSNKVTCGCVGTWYYSMKR